MIWIGVNAATTCSLAKSLLTRGDEGLLVAPLADFGTELRRIKIDPVPFQAVTSKTYDYHYDDDELSGVAEQEDLRAALKQAGASEADAGRITTNQLARRRQLSDFQQRFASWEAASPREYDTNGHWTLKPVTPPPRFPQLDKIDELPAEFVDYLEGGIAWQNPAFTDKNVAREAWERILSRPAEQRHFKSTWAAFMLGRSWQKESPEKAIAYYEKVRTLAKGGFADSAGLAASSLGQEARIYLNQTNYERAIELYLQQLAAGDDGAYLSLCRTLRSLFSGGTASFPALAKNPQTRRVVTAYIVSTKALQLSVAFRYSSDPETPHRLVRVVNDWLDAVEAVGVNDPQTAEELALAAYQNGQWDTAKTWISLARSSPTAQWLQAKLLLRAGKRSEAASLLARLERLFPLDPPDTNAPMELKDHLTAPDSEHDVYGIDAPEQIRGELGVCLVGSGDYDGALDRFMSARLWTDAAYVAERLLSLDELKEYVDRQWPAQPATRAGDDGSENSNVESEAWDGRENIRYLLARRLTREIRGNESREYYPKSCLPNFDALASALTIGWNESLSAEERARALFSAGCLARAYGMELLGTELAPDWQIYGGSDEGHLTSSWRTNTTFSLFPATSDELRRDAEHKPDPDVRFHYRYQAAFLAWEATKLMPDNSDETARVLWTAGSWLKDRDPQTADIFYKALVRRCRKTALGDEADRKRWFPSTDDARRFDPRPLRLEDRTPSEESDAVARGEEPAQEIEANCAAPGTWYVVQAGDSIAEIVRAAGVLGQPITVSDLFAANPGLESTRLLVGQKIMIPAVKPNPAPE